MSLLRRLTASERILAVLGVSCVLFAAAAVAANPEVLDVERPDPAGNPTPADPTPEPEASPDATLVTTTVSTPILGAPELGAPQVSALRAGIATPVIDRTEHFYLVLTPCEVEGWVAAGDVRVVPPAPEGWPQRFEDATFVIDPGHGGWDPGAVGPGGLTETEINLTITNLLVDLMRSPRTIDRETGAVVPGEEFGTPRVFLTRETNHSAGLRYRTAIGSSLRAHGFVSIHNNAAPDGPSTRPGTETYYQISSAESRRLAGLTYEELFTVFSQYDVGWVGDRDAGAKYRPSENGGDYYGVLRRSEGPAVLVEALFISNPPEEALLRDPEVQRQIAQALYRALVRYIVTDQPGSGFVEPYQRGSGAAVRVPSDCVDPA